MIQPKAKYTAIRGRESASQEGIISEIIIALTCSFYSIDYDIARMASSSKVVLILGAGANVGQHVARQFASKGYKVATTSRSEKATEGISESVHIAADLSKPESVAGVFSQLKASVGIPSVVVYNGQSAARETVNTCTQG